MSAGSSRIFVASTSCSICGIFDTPTTGDVISGLFIIQASAICAGVLPYFSATSATRSAIAKVAAPL